MTTHTTRARDRYAQLRALSDAGATKSEAARQVRVSLSGLHGILYREVGSRAWPIAATSPQQGEA
jgi:hypothetical protein